jgi:hypothetical protein
MFLHTYIHTYIRTYIHTYIHTYIYSYIHTNIYTYVHIFIHTYKHIYIRTYIHTHTYIKITFKCALCLHIREFLSICYWVLFLIVFAHLVLSTFTSTPVYWLSCCRIYNDLHRFLCIYILPSCTTVSPPLSQNHGWCGQFRATYSTVFHIQIIITVYHQHHHHHTLLGSAEFSL